MTGSAVSRRRHRARAEHPTVGSTGPLKNVDRAGNHAGPPADYLSMTCDEIRVALSARLDGEDPQVPPARLDAHLAGCAGCRSWLEEAGQLTRTVRVQAVQVPDLTAAVLRAVAADPTGTAGRRQATAAHARRQILRVAVAAAALAQLVIAVRALVGGLDLPGGFGVAADPHTSREMASFDVALAVGFMLAAYRPEQARVFVPVAFVLAACLAATSAVDIANATTVLVNETGHAVAVVQAVLLWALGRATGRPGGPVAAAPVAV